MKLILLLSLIIFYIHFNNATIQELTNPVVPIKLGKAKIISTKHTFVSYINITDFFKLKEDLKNQVVLISGYKSESSMLHELSNQAWTLINQINRLLTAIYPKIRKRRGLIDVGGNALKWVFGTMDNDDCERINAALDHLNKNDHLLQEKINDQMSLVKDFMKQTNETLFEIRSNIITTTKLIEKYQQGVNTINALHLVINSLISLENTLSQIINAVTFAHLNKVHPIFLSLGNLKSITTKISQLYQEEQLVHFINYQNYYKFLGIQLVSNEDRIIFLIHFPILNPLSFNTYFVYPIPIQNKIISPPKPYLILDEETRKFQYEDDVCEKIEETFYCKNNLEANEDCVVNIISLNNASSCSTLLVRMETPMINQVTPQNVLLTASVAQSITEICHTETHSVLNPGSYLISISETCHVTIGKETFYSSKDTISPATVVLLPSLNMSVLKKPITTLKLESIDLQEIKHITSLMNDRNKLVLPEMPQQSSQQGWYWIPSISGVTICMMILLGICLYYKCNHSYSIIKISNETRERGTRTPPLLT